MINLVLFFKKAWTGSGFKCDGMQNSIMDTRQESGDEIKLLD